MIFLIWARENASRLSARPGRGTCLPPSRIVASSVYLRVHFAPLVCLTVKQGGLGGQGIGVGTCSAQLMLPYSEPHFTWICNSGRLAFLGLSLPSRPTPSLPGLPRSSCIFSSAISQPRQRTGEFVGPEQTAAFAVGLYLFLALSHLLASHRWPWSADSKSQTKPTDRGSRSTPRPKAERTSPVVCRSLCPSEPKADLRR